MVCVLDAHKRALLVQFAGLEGGSKGVGSFLHGGVCHTDFLAVKVFHTGLHRNENHAAKGCLNGITQIERGLEIQFILHDDKLGEMSPAPF